MSRCRHVATTKHHTQNLCMPELIHPAVHLITNCARSVPIVSVERPNITVPEGDPDVEICIVLTTGVTEQVIVTAVIGPKSGTTNPATGK